MDQREAVILVHGLWMTGVETGVLALRLQQAGHRTSIFSYRSVKGGIEENARALHEHIRAVDAERVHIVAHSLGGLVVLSLLEQGFGIGKPGRIVLMGSPVRGSAAARGLSKLPLGEELLGNAGDLLLRFEAREWVGSHEIGILAGTRAVGLGRLFSRLPKPNDGTVAVEETELRGATDSIQLPVTHTGMLFDRGVADQVIDFLQTGRFSEG